MSKAPGSHAVSFRTSLVVAFGIVGMALFAAYVEVISPGWTIPIAGTVGGMLGAMRGSASKRIPHSLWAPLAGGALGGAIVALIGTSVAILRAGYFSVEHEGSLLVTTATVGALVGAILGFILGKPLTFALRKVIESAVKWIWADPPTHRPRRIWFPFSLRTLLAATTVIALGLVFIVNAAHRQQRAVASIEEVGGLVMYDYSFVGETMIIQGATPYGPEVLRRMLGGLGHHFFNTVVYVGLDNGQVDDSHLEVLEKLPDLVALFLGESSTGDDGMRHLAELVNLEALYLTDTNVTDAGLIHLRGLINLELLSLAGTQVTDGGLRNLQGLSELREVNLDRTRVSDAGLAHIGGLRKLERLYLEDTAVTDAGLKHLTRLAKLKTLWLVGTEVTKTGTKELQQSLQVAPIARSRWVPKLLPALRIVRERPKRTPLR